jgi:Ca2+-binding RTX toxin-like protein
VYVATATGVGGKVLDVGVIVLGSTGNDALAVVGNDKIITVSNNTPLAPGAGCTTVDANTVRCDVTGKPLHYVAVWGDDGADNIEVRGDFPREFESHVSGGKNSDHLIGADQQDVFFTGVNGEDWLEGMGGDDALLSESDKNLGWRDGNRPEASQYNDGADRLDGGDGNDQLVVDYVCGGHRFIGGNGQDIAGFARSGKYGIHAQLGGPSNLKTNWYGKAANMQLCGNLPGRWTTWKTGVDADLEVLESSDGPDRLWGDDRANVIWSRGGGDIVYALGGNDEIRGADGNDKLYGGAGNNNITYGAE